MSDVTLSSCPCGRPLGYSACCGALHAGLRSGLCAAQTAEDLMRSRFSAFAVGDVPYLLATWHPSTRPSSLDLDADTVWTRLRILAHVAGGPADTEGTVAFRAHFRTGGPGGAGERGAQSETSRFVRSEDGRWLYLDGDVDTP